MAKKAKAPVEPKLGNLPENVIYGPDGKTPMAINTVDDAVTFLDSFNRLGVRGKSGYTTYWNAHGPSNPEHPRKALTAGGHLRILLCFLDAAHQNRAECIANGGSVKIGREIVTTEQYDQTLKIVREYDQRATEAINRRQTVSRLMNTYITGDADEKEFVKVKLGKMGVDADAELAARKAQEQAQAVAAAELEKAEAAAETTAPAEGTVTPPTTEGTGTVATEGTEAAPVVTAETTASNTAPAPAVVADAPKADAPKVDAPKAPENKGNQPQGKGNKHRQHANA